MSFVYSNHTSASTAISMQGGLKNKLPKQPFDKYSVNFFSSGAKPILGQNCMIPSKTESLTLCQNMIETIINVYLSVSWNDS